MMIRPTFTAFTTLAAIGATVGIALLQTGCEGSCEDKRTCPKVGQVGGGGSGGDGVGGLGAGGESVGGGGQGGDGGSGGGPDLTPRMQKLSADNLKSCVISPDGEVYCWGWAISGHLGNGDETNTDYTTATKVLEVEGATTIGGSCAILAGGALKCWGSNSHGQVGVGNKVNQPIPQLVALENVTAVVDAGSSLTRCALQVSGAVSCWGDNTSGEIGSGPFGFDAIGPVKAEIDGVEAIYRTRGRSFAKLGNGDLWSWPVGQGLLPQKVDFFFDPKDLAADFGAKNPGCATTEEGKAYCWGENLDGQLGNGTNTPSDIAVQVLGISDVTAIVAGAKFRCALREQGRVSCWGLNSTGQLGVGTIANSTTPVEVSSIQGAVALAAGSGHVCALLTDESVWCWGGNEHGQLGNGSTEPSGVPVQVMGLP